MSRTQEVIIHTDGGSRGNPGPSAASFVLTDPDGNRLEAKGLFLGNSTNNVAEYTGVVKALEVAKQIGAGKVKLFSDSELLVRQINGQYKVKSKNLQDLYREAVALLNTFEKWKVMHVSRHKNVAADYLVNLALDNETNVQQTSAGQPETFVSSCRDKRPETDVAKTKPIRLGVLISGGGRTMLNILESIDKGRLNARIAVVISSRSTVPGVERAKKAGMTVKIVRKKDFQNVDEFSKRMEEELVTADVDLVVQGGWLCLWRIPQRYINRVMNIHPALLPSFGGKGMWGRHVHQAVLKTGCKISGCTVHFCTNEYDKGPIILQRCCDVKDDDMPETLAARVFEQECIAYPEAIELFGQGRLLVKDGRVKIKSSD